MKYLWILTLLIALQLNISKQNKLYDSNKIDSEYKGLVLLRKNVVSEKYFSYKRDDDKDDDDDPGNPDYYAIIERPCPFFDIFCIRKFFAQHSKCKIVPGPVKEPFYLTELQLNPTVFNLTVTLTDLPLTGFNGRIEEFYVNKATGNLVISVFFEGIKSIETIAYLRFNKNGEEAVETTAVAAFDFAKIAITTVIPNYENLRLEDAEVNAFLDDPVPPFIFAPTSINVVDLTALAQLAAIPTDIPTAALEALATISPIFASIFIQKNICDFGVPINRI